MRFFSAIRDKFSEGYQTRDLIADVMAGLIVCVVAVPLGMALAIASGAAPQYGLYTVVIGGGIVALLGGSRFQVTGPTAAFVAILLPIVQKFGFAGLLVSGLIAGLILLIMGYARMGKLIQFIPYPVTTGFTSGIAVVIVLLQIKDFLGLSIEQFPEHFLGKVIILFSAVNTFSYIETTIGISTLAILVCWPRLNKKIPAPIVALTLISIGVVILRIFVPHIDVATIGSRFSYEINGIIKEGIPQTLPILKWPWNFAGTDGKPFVFDLEMIRSIIPSAFAIAMLGAIESLLSAVVADGMANTKHDPDAELIALGIGNILCPFFGGIPATGAIARTATNIRFGAKSPLSAVFHSIFTLFVIVLFAPYVSYLPMAALAALLILVAYNMSEIKHFTHILKVAPRSDVVVLLICFFLTVVFDMVVGVTVGVMLASLLFMKRMAEFTESHKVIDAANDFSIKKNLPHDIILYEIEGPLFFGAAEKAASAIMNITDQVRVVIFIMNNVPIMDMTGFVALESAIEKLFNGKRMVFLVGLKPQPTELILKSGLISKYKDIQIIKTVDEAIKMSRIKS